jgi:integrase
MPSFLVDEARDHLALPGVAIPGKRVFRMTKSRLYHEMERGSKIAGVPRIRVHDLRHSHVSLLIDMGYSPLAIAERMGHETTEITLHYAHLFPNRQEEMAQGLDAEGRCPR